MVAHALDSVRQLVIVDVKEDAEKHVLVVVLVNVEETVREVAVQIAQKNVEVDVPLHVQMSVL